MTQHPSSHRGDGNRIPVGPLEFRTPLRYLFAPAERSCLEGRFSYSTVDPYAVRLDLILNVDIEVTWFVSRELLAAGLTTPSGDGDFRAWPSIGPQRDQFYFSMQRLDGQATFETSLPAVRQWLDLTYQVVPAGDEALWFDWDATIADLLWPLN